MKAVRLRSKHTGCVYSGVQLPIAPSDPVPVGVRRLIDVDTGGQVFAIPRSFTFPNDPSSQRSVEFAIRNPGDWILWLDGGKCDLDPMCMKLNCSADGVAKRYEVLGDEAVEIPVVVNSH